MIRRTTGEASRPPTERTPPQLPPPHADAPDHTSTYGPLFWVALVVGGAFMVFGLLTLFSKAAATQPLNFAVFFVGLALVHDLLLAPAVIIVATGVRRVSPRMSRGLLCGSLAISAIIVAFALPMVLRWGDQPDNPSFLPRDYSFGLAIVLAVVWGLAAAVLVDRRRRRGRP